MTGFTKINAFCDRAMARMDELGDEAIQAMRNTPEAKARQAENAAKTRKAAAARAAKMAKGRKAAVDANVFEIGQVVRSARRLGADFMTATVTAVEGSSITLDNGRTFAAGAFVAA